MDLGATICTPRNPACALCPSAPALRGQLAPKPPCRAKPPKPEKPTRTGTLWLARRRDGAWLVEQRPERGLLGGMLGFPGNDWDGAGGATAVDTKWRTVGEIRHTFTHFHLILQVETATLPPGMRQPGQFIPHNAFSPADLPTLMRKAYDAAAATFGHVEKCCRLRYAPPKPGVPHDHPARPSRPLAQCAALLAFLGHDARGHHRGNCRRVGPLRCCRFLHGACFRFWMRLRG